MDDTALLERRNQLRSELQDHTIYELLGAEPGIRAIVDAFYDLMQSESEFGPIRVMHAPDPLRCARVCTSSCPAGSAVRRCSSSGPGHPA